MKLLKLLVLSFYFVTAVSEAASLAEEFTSRANLNSATALWNHGTGFITPTVVIKDWSNGSNQTSTLDLGDGSHGPFNSTTWSQFAVSIDSTAKIIYLNTTAYPIFKFTTFQLPVGWTLEPVGTNPLIIYVLGDMQVDGIIQCSGQSGNDPTGTGASAVPGSGGAGRCGGASGGNGGARYPGVGSVAGQNGNTASGLISGGVAGTTNAVGTGSGGGGGGAWATSIAGANGVNGSGGTGGAFGTAVSDPIWAQVLGSAGGGGGSGGGTEAGAGGGGGGGVIILHVGGELNVGAAGEILANGGNGGNSPNDGGAGGAGGGGSIQIWVAGSMTLLGPGNNAISAATGVAGNSSTGGDGGIGYEGRTWISYQNFVAPTGATIYPGTELVAEGNPRYHTGSVQEVISNAWDTESTLADFTSASFSPASAAVQLEVAGSNDGFISDDSGWVSASNIAQLNSKRYLKFKLTINNTDDTNPARVDQVTVQYTPGERKDFEFKTSGCGSIGPTGTGSPFVAGLVLSLLLLPLFVWIRLRRPVAF